jgi:hypothetical protein
MQYAESDSHPVGGFYLSEFTWKSIKYKIKRLYSWPTIFAIHAFHLVDAMRNRAIRGRELW